MQLEAQRTSTHELRARGGFTLVELLVVVTIIVILIAMLVPALEKALRHAHKVHCLANLHAMGLGFVLYTQDHKLYYPSATGNYTVVGNVGMAATQSSDPQDPNNPLGREPASAPSWRRPLNPYVGYPSSGDEGTIVADNTQMEATGELIPDIRVKIAECPADLGDPFHRHANAYESHGSSYIAAWNANSFRTNYVVSMFGNTNSVSKKSTQFSMTQKKMVMGDLPWHGTRHFRDEQSRWHSVTERGFNHLFADSHAEYVVADPSEIEDDFGWAGRPGSMSWKWW